MSPRSDGLRRHEPQRSKLIALLGSCASLSERCRPGPSLTGDPHPHTAVPYLGLSPGALLDGGAGQGSGGHKTREESREDVADPKGNELLRQKPGGRDAANRITWQDRHQVLKEEEEESKLPSPPCLVAPGTAHMCRFVSNLIEAPRQCILCLQKNGPVYIYCSEPPQFKVVTTIIDGVCCTVLLHDSSHYMKYIRRHCTA